MRKSIRILIVFLGLLPAAIYAQGGKMIRAQVEELRKNIYTREMGLTDAELQKFWPVFQQMQEQANHIKKEIRRERMRVMDNYATISDDEVTKAIAHVFELDQQLLDLQKKYYAEYEKVLPVKKVALIPKAERAFKAELLSRFKRLQETDD